MVRAAGSSVMELFFFAYWTISSFLLALVLVIVGGGVAGFVIQRVFLPNLQIESPVETLKRHERNKLYSSAAVLAGLSVAMIAYPLGCVIGIDINFLGLSDKALNFWLIMGPGILVLIYRAKRQARARKDREE